MAYGIEMGNKYGDVVIDEELGHLIFSEYHVIHNLWPRKEQKSSSSLLFNTFDLDKEYETPPLIAFRLVNGGVIPHAYPIKSSLGDYRQIKVYVGDNNMYYDVIEMMVMGSSLDPVVVKTIPPGETYGLQTLLPDGETVLFDSRWTELVTSAQIIPYPDLSITTPTTNLLTRPVVSTETRTLTTPYWGYFYCLAGVYGNKQRETPLQMTSDPLLGVRGLANKGGGNYVPSLFVSSNSTVTLIPTRTGGGPHEEDFLGIESPSYHKGAPFDSTPFGGHVAVLRYEPLDDIDLNELLPQPNETRSPKWQPQNHQS